MKKFAFILFCLLGIYSTLYSQCVCSSAGSCVIPANVFSGNSLTIEKNSFFAELNTDYRKFSGNNDFSIKSLSTISHTQPIDFYQNSFRLSYGISSKLMATIQVPIVYSTWNDWNNPEYLNTDKIGFSSSGIGDLLLTTNYLAFVGSESSNQISIISGIELSVVPMKMQANSNVSFSSGSFDPLLGFVYLHKKNKFRIRANSVFKFTTNSIFHDHSSHNHTVNSNHAETPHNMGSNWVSEIALIHQLFNNSADTTSQNQFSISGTVCIGNEHIMFSKVESKDQNRSLNFTRFYSSAGIIINYKKIVFPLSISIPFYQKLYGIQSNQKLNIRAGLAYSF
jgi:hypothetical protein